MSRKGTLSFEKAQEIRALYATGDWYRTRLAVKFGVSGSMITKILRNQRWYDRRYTPPSGDEANSHEMRARGERSRARLLLYLKAVDDARMRPLTVREIVAALGKPRLLSCQYHLRRLEQDGLVVSSGSLPRRISYVRKEK